MITVPPGTMLQDAHNLTANGYALVLYDKTTDTYYIPQSNEEYIALLEDGLSITTVADMLWELEYANR